MGLGGYGDAVTVDGELIGVLRRVTGRPGLEYERAPEAMRGGFWAELLSFSLADPPDGWPAELVARLMPDPGAARKETIVQSAVAAAGFPTPVVRASGGPDSGLGRAFMVMDRAAGRPALAGLDGALTPAAVGRLARQLPELLAGPVPDVICHGDLHPFNLLADGDRVTALDWSTALLAPRACDVAFTSLLLGEPPLRVPGWQRPLVRVAGTVLARRFVRGYQRRTAVAIESGQLSWYQAVVCLRVLVEVASWVHQGVPDSRAGHPWLITGPSFARRLTTFTGVTVRAR